MRIAGVWIVVGCGLVSTPPVRGDPPLVVEAVKVGEVTSTSANVWVRLSAEEAFDEEAFTLDGSPGELTVEFRSDGADSWQRTPWARVSNESDFVGEIELSGLNAGSLYRYRVWLREVDGTEVGGGPTGSFWTAPARREATAVVFTVTTGHRFESNDRPGEGQRIYDSMLELGPRFMVHTGDILYYDQGDHLAKSIEDARAKWHRLYSLPAHRRFHSSVSTYFMKDDHDLLKDDCWPGQRYGEFTFEQGRRVFMEQTPVGERSYRTFRWGRDLQVWLVEGRDFRSENPMPDGPEKTIWGSDQWAWLERTVAESDATFKILVSPTPIVGPDRQGKNDNHANAGFGNEGERVRRFIASTENMIVICGDRHWQYVSRDDETGVVEYSCGPSTDQHAGGWAAQDLRPEHSFLRVAGGFLSAEIVPKGESATLFLRLHATDGAVVYAEDRTARYPAD